MKFLKRISNGEVDWVAKVPEETRYLDENVVEITEEEFLELSRKDEDLGVC